jgi:nucleotidyltransferase substrate binding protein (TIGR01987 family)
MSMVYREGKSKHAGWLADNLKMYNKSVEGLTRFVEMDAPSMMVITRFELCFELAWRLLKNCLQDREIYMEIPRSVINEAIKLNMIEESWNILVDDKDLLRQIKSSSSVFSVSERIKNLHYLEFEKLSQTARSLQVR